MPDTDSKRSAKENIVITVGRQFGSGGRELGRKIADRLGFKYYDKELMSRAASGGGISEEFVRNNDERTPKFLSGMFTFSMGFSPMSWYSTPTNISSDKIYETQSDAIRKIASEGPCVIVGRSADYVLRDFPRVVNIFVHAPAEACIDRIVSRHDEIDRQKAKALMEKTNRLRAKYYNFYTDKQWGHAASYDLTFDTSKMPMDDIAAIVEEYVSRRFG